MNRFNKLNNFRNRKKKKHYMSPELEKNKLNEKHIMFSYSWKQQEKVKSIYNKIEENFNYSKLWIDFKKMKGNILESINNAIENSYLILIFLSKNYKNSKNCKIESELIIGKNKKFILINLEKGYPYNNENEEDNWLEKLYKNQFYIDLSEMNLDNLDRLIKDIQSETIEYYKKYKIYKPNLPIEIYNDNEEYLNNLNNELNDFNLDNSYNLNKSTSNINYLNVDDNPYKLHKLKERRMSSSSIQSNLTTFTNVSITTNGVSINELVENNDIDENDVEKIKELLEQTPRTTTTVLNASGVSMKSIISLLQEIKLK
jgi:hypothetical protein